MLLGCSGGALELSLGALGVLLEPLGASRVPLVISWGALGASWGAPGAPLVTLGMLWGRLGASWVAAVVHGLALSNSLAAFCFQLPRFQSMCFSLLSLLTVS